MPTETEIARQKTRNIMVWGNPQVLISKKRMKDADIDQLLVLYESDDYFEFWRGEVAKTDLTNDQKALLQRHFPRGNWLRRLVQDMAHGLPFFAVTFKGADGEEMEEKGEKELQKWLAEKFNTKGWEGDLNFWQALSFYREMVLLTGRLVIKIVGESDDTKGTLVARPQRMPQRGIAYVLSETDRKSIQQWVFTYLNAGSTAGTTHKDVVVNESIDKVMWVIKRSDQKDFEEFEIPKEYDFIPVSYLAWEILESEPLGMAYGRRLSKKILNIISILTDIRTANRLNSDPIKVVTNGDLQEGQKLRAGQTVSVTGKEGAPNADVKLIGGNLNIDSLFTEL